MSEHRVFLAHAKSDDSINLKLLLTQKLQGHPYVITTGKDDYEARFKACGTWDSWTSSIASGKIMGVDRFQSIIVPVYADRTIGRATMQIVVGALAVDKSCYTWDRTTSVLQRISAVETVDTKNWQAGWRLVEAQDDA